MIGVFILLLVNGVTLFRNLIFVLFSKEVKKLMTLEVRKLKEEDISQVLSLYNEFLEDQYSKNKYAVGDYGFKKSSVYYEKVIRSDRDEIFVGDDCGEVVGFVAISIVLPNFFSEFGSHGYLYDGFVKEEYRTSKLSFRLFNACEKWAKEKNCEYITTYAYAFNRRVQICFQSQKMEPYKITYIKKLSEGKSRDGKM